jgi:hypothetical protein
MASEKSFDEIMAAWRRDQRAVPIEPPRYFRDYFRQDLRRMFRAIYEWIARLGRSR